MKIIGSRKFVGLWINYVFGGGNETLIDKCLSDIEKMPGWDESAIKGVVTKIYVQRDQTKYRLYCVSARERGSNEGCALFFIKDNTYNGANIIGIYKEIAESSYKMIWRGPRHRDGYWTNPYNLPETIIL